MNIIVWILVIIISFIVFKIWFEPYLTKKYNLYKAEQILKRIKKSLKKRGKLDINLEKQFNDVIEDTKKLNKSITLDDK